VKLSRRNLLQLAAARLAAQGMATRTVKPTPRGKPSGIPFHAHFTDIAEAAGLHAPTIYGGVSRKDYIVETMGCGCALLDYDNDGLLDLFVCGEYISPFSEINDHIVNLDLPVGFTSPPVPVQVGQSGPYNGGFPVTLVRPDRNNFAPRLGLAWKPLRNTLVRAGYGINYNTAAYQSIVQNMAFQPPFSTTATNTQSATTLLTLQNGFPAVAPGSVTIGDALDSDKQAIAEQAYQIDLAPTAITITAIRYRNNIAM
jgi:hypothetical protein